MPTIKLRDSVMQIFSVFSPDLDEEPDVDGKLGSLDQLRQRRRWMVQQRNKTKRLQLSALFAAALLVGVGLIQTSGSDPLQFLMLLYGSMFIIAALTARGRLRMILEDLQDLDFDIDLQQFRVTPRESRAERLLRMHQLQLRRYYDLNLVQSVWMFALGIFCILLGVSIIAATLYMLSQPSIWSAGSATLSEKIIVATLGGIGAILTNFIGVVYLRMHAANADSMRAFHDRLAEMQDLLLGNLLAPGLKQMIRDRRRFLNWHWQSASEADWHVSEA